MPHAVKFIEENKIVVGEKVLELPVSLIWGISLAVILFPGNEDEWQESDKAFHVNQLNVDLPLDALWGAQDHLEWLVKTLDLTERRTKTQD